MLNSGTVSLNYGTYFLTSATKIHKTLNELSKIIGDFKMVCLIDN